MLRIFTLSSYSDVNPFFFFFFCTWEVVQSCALADGRGELFFLKFIIKLSVDGLRGVGGALIRMSAIRTVGRDGSEVCE